MNFEASPKSMAFRALRLARRSRRHFRGVVATAVAAVMLIGPNNVANWAIQSARAQPPGVNPPRTDSHLWPLVQDLQRVTEESFPDPDSPPDTDGDGLYDPVELVIGTDPGEPDSDYDGLDDRYEVENDLDPLNPDSNYDGLPDWAEVNEITDDDPDGDGWPNAWDIDNDGDGVSDSVDLCPFVKTDVVNQIDLTIITSTTPASAGHPLFIELQLRPENPEHLRLYGQYWDWPYDDKGSMQDTNGSDKDVRMIPSLKLTVTPPLDPDELPDGIQVDGNHVTIVLSPVIDHGHIVAFSAKLPYRSDAQSPIELRSAKLVWHMIGETDQSEGPVPTLLAAYEEDFMLTGATVEEPDYGATGAVDVAVFYSTDLEDIVGANLFLAYGFLRVPDKHVKDMPTALAEAVKPGDPPIYPFSEVEHQIEIGLPHVADAFEALASTLVPDAVEWLKNNASVGTTALPIVIALESDSKIVSLGEFTPDPGSAGSFEVDLTPSDSMTAITLKTAWYDLTAGEALSIEDVIGHIQNLGLDGESADALATLTLYWTTGEQSLSGPGMPPVQPPEDFSDIVNTSMDVAEYGLSGMEGMFRGGALLLSGYKMSKLLGFKGWASTLKTFKTGLGKLKVGKFSRMIKGASHAQKSVKSLKMLAKAIHIIDIIAIAAVVGIAFVELGFIADAYGMDSFAYAYAALSTAFEIMIEAFLFVLAMTPYVGWIIVAALAILDAVVGWMDTLTNILASLFSSTDAATPHVKLLNCPDPDPSEPPQCEPNWPESPIIKVEDDSVEGLTVGDEITYTAILRNYASGPNPAKARSHILSYLDTTAAELPNTIVDWAIDDPSSRFNESCGFDAGAGPKTGIPSSADWLEQVTQHQGTYETGVKVTPGVAMPNFPVRLILETCLTMCYNWSISIIFELDSGTDCNAAMKQTAGDFTLYFDVMPASLDEIDNWIGVTPLDRDRDGLTNAEEGSTLRQEWFGYAESTLEKKYGLRMSDIARKHHGRTGRRNTGTTDPWKYDTDGDGLNDKYELDIGTDPRKYDSDGDGLIDWFEVQYGTDPKLEDSDGDGLEDYFEVSGWVVEFPYGDTGTCNNGTCMGGVNNGDTCPDDNAYCNTVRMRVYSDPAVPDSDGDDVDDNMEYLSNLNPRSADTDGDGVEDVENPIESRIMLAEEFCPDGVPGCVEGRLELELPTQAVVDSLAVGADGQLYLGLPKNTDLTSHWVQEYRPNGAFLRERGLSHPSRALALNEYEDHLYVATFGEMRRVEKWNLDQWGHIEESHALDLSHNYWELDFTWDADNSLYSVYSELHDEHSVTLHDYSSGFSRGPEWDLPTLGWLEHPDDIDSIGKITQLAGVAVSPDPACADTGGTAGCVYLADLHGAGSWNWGPPSPLNNYADSDGSSDTSPQLATDSLGNWVAVWESTNSLGGTIGTDLDILFSRSTDDGSTWSPARVLNSNATSESHKDQRPQIATDAEGHWMAVWARNRGLDGYCYDDDIFFSRSFNDGRTWTNAEQLTATGSGTCYDALPQLATDGRGNWVAAWYSSTLHSGLRLEHDIVFARSTNYGASWSTPKGLNTDAAYDRRDDVGVALATDSDDNWIAVWSAWFSPYFPPASDPDIFFSTSGNGGITWTPPKALNTNAASDSVSDIWPRLMSYGPGRWVAVWESSGSSYTDILFSRSTNNGASWTAPKLVHRSGEGYVAEPQLMTDGPGRWVVVWESTEDLGGTIGTDKDILFSKSADYGANWTPPAPLNTNAASSDSRDDHSPQLATDGEGHWVVAWASQDSLGGTIGTDSDILFSLPAMESRLMKFAYDENYDYLGLWTLPDSGAYDFLDTSVWLGKPSQALAIDADRFLYVADPGNDRVVMLDENARYANEAEWQFPSRTEGVSIATNGDGSFVYLAVSYDAGTPSVWNARISQFFRTTGEPDTVDIYPTDRDEDGLLNDDETTGWEITYTHETDGPQTETVTSDPLLFDTDLDGLSDFEERQYGTNPRKSDTDGDGVLDVDEVGVGSGALSLTLRRWGRSNPTHFDTDLDGLPDGVEQSYRSDPTKEDTDEDGLADAAEFMLMSNPSNGDTDGDGLGDKEEYNRNADLRSPDTDGDFVFDGREVELGTDLHDTDSDDDGLTDGMESIYKTDPLSSDTDGDNIPDAREVQLLLNPTSRDTDGDGTPDGTELELGTNPLLKDTDFDGIPDDVDTDSDAEHVADLVLAFDPGEGMDQFAADLAVHTAVTIASSVDNPAVQFADVPYVVLVGRPDGGGPVGTLIHDLLNDAGSVLPDMIESDNNRFATRHGVWTPTQTVVMLSQPYSSDHIRVLDDLRRKTVSITPDRATVAYRAGLTFAVPNEPGEFFHGFYLDEIDTVKQTDAIVAAGFDYEGCPTVEMNRYDAMSTPQPLTDSSGLVKYDIPLGKYLEVTLSEEGQVARNEYVEDTCIRVHYRELDLDRTGDGDVDDPEDFNEETLGIYRFDESSGEWIKLSEDLDWVLEARVDTDDVQLYGESYAGSIMACVSELSLFGLAGQTYNRPPEISEAYPSEECVWPPNHEFVDVIIKGVTDPDDDEIEITIVDITSDEPDGAGGKKRGRDAYGIGTNTAHLKAERLGTGNGRVYAITFTASDGRGGEDTGTVTVCVPHDRRGKTCDCIDDGQVHNVVTTRGRR